MSDVSVVIKYLGLLPPTQQRKDENINLAWDAPLRFRRDSRVSGHIAFTSVKVIISSDKNSKIQTQTHKFITDT
jgi:hypothetical protein